MLPTYTQIGERVEKKMIRRAEKEHCNACGVARQARHRQREMAKALRTTPNESEKIMCTICQDDIEDKSKAVVTLCGHVFHTKCTKAYRKSILVDGLKRIRGAYLSGSLDTSEAEVGFTRLLIEYEIGKRCPNCRCVSPFLHHLALKTTFKNRCYNVHELRVQLSATDVLAFATRS